VNGAFCLIRTAGGLACLVRHDKRFATSAPVTLMVRPERFQVARIAPETENRFEGRVRGTSFTGDRLKYEIEINDRDRVTAIVANRGEAALLAADDRVELGWNADDAVLFAAADAPS